MSLPGGSDNKESACNSGDPSLIPGLGRSLWRREWIPTPVFLPGEFHGQRNLVGFGSWGCKESDTTDWLTLSLSLLIHLWCNVWSEIFIDSIDVLCWFIHFDSLPFNCMFRQLNGMWFLICLDLGLSLYLFYVCSFCFSVLSPFFLSFGLFEYFLAFIFI